MEQRTNEKDKRIRVLSRRALIIRNTALTVVCFVLGIVIALQYKSIQARKNDNTTLSTISEYQNRIIELTKELDVLNQDKSELTQKIQQLEQGSNQEQIEKLEKELLDVRTFAGLTRVSGSGLKISLEFYDSDDLSISDAKIQRLINEIKASTAQAISINGARITAMSEVRVVNNYLVINGRQYSQPFEILVIGNPTSLISALNVQGVASSFASVAKLEYQKSDTITINAFNPEDINISLMTPVD